MKRTFLAIAILLCAGCLPWGPDLKEASGKADRLGKQAQQISETLETSIQQADAVVDRLEDVTGKSLSGETIGKIEAMAKKTETLLQKVDKATSFIEKVPGPQQPFAVAADKVVGGISLVAGAIAAFMANRRRKRTKAGLEAMVKATADIPDMAKKTAAATSDPEAVAAIKEAFNATN